MSNEHDVGINLIAAAMRVLEGEGFVAILRDDAVGFLKREFARNLPTVITDAAEVGHVTLDVHGAVCPRCPKVRPGRSSRLLDAARCHRPEGHAGPCDFNAAASPA